MSSSRSLVFSAVIAAVIAIALVSGVVAIGVLNTRTTLTRSGSQTSTESNSSPQIGQSSTSTSESNSSPLTESSSTFSAIQSSSSQNGSPGNGMLAVLMTDPPTVPVGVTSVFINYSNMAIHVGGAGNYTGWHAIDVQGEIDLMSVINSTQTVADADVPSGNFNALAFNVSSAVVTFEGVNYSADLVYQQHTLVVPIVGGINITNDQSSAAVIDLSPTVLLLGNLTDPTFAFLPSARAYTVPAQSVSSLNLHVGSRENIQTAPWWVRIQYGLKFEITSISLSPTSLSFTVLNTGNSTMEFRMAYLSSTTSIAGGNIPLSNLASTLSISEVFVIERNSTLIPITVIGNGSAANLIDSSGYYLPPKASATLSFSGNITLGVVQSTAVKHAPQKIIPGQKYVLTLTGSGLVAQAIVTATS